MCHNWQFSSFHRDHYREIWDKNYAMTHIQIQSRSSFLYVCTAKFKMRLSFCFYWPNLFWRETCYTLWWPHWYHNAKLKYNQSAFGKILPNFSPIWKYFSERGMFHCVLSRKPFSFFPSYLLFSHLFLLSLTYVTVHLSSQNPPVSSLLGKIQTTRVY